TPVFDILRGWIDGTGGEGGGGFVSVEVLPAGQRPPPPPLKGRIHPTSQRVRVPRSGIEPSRPGSAVRPSGQSGSEARGSLLVIVGTIFDLWTLEPVSETTLIFHSAVGDRYFSTRTLADGKFRIELPVSVRGGYYLKVRHSGYIERALLRNADQVA